MRPCMPDGLPVMGRIPGVEGAYISCAHNCWGILWGPVRLPAQLCWIRCFVYYIVCLTPAGCVWQSCWWKGRARQLTWPASIQLDTWWRRRGRKGVGRWADKKLGSNGDNIRGSSVFYVFVKINDWMFSSAKRNSMKILVCDHNTVV